MGFVVGQVSMADCFLSAVNFSLSVSLHYCLVAVFTPSINGITPA